MNYNKEYTMIIDAIRIFFKNEHFTKAVVGLSGGIDSSVVACLIANSLGKNNVIGVALPSKFTSKTSSIIVNELVKNIGIRHFEMPISDTNNSMHTQLEKYIDMNNITNENLQSRIRMVYLMAVANSEQALLMDTGNHTENYLGYATLYGDLAGAFAPIAHLTKTQVYELGRHINHQEKMIPELTFTRKPTAELSQGQEDPFDYEIYSDICWDLSSGKNKDEMMAKYDTEMVNDAIHRHSANLFKLRYMPPNINNFNFTK